MTIKRQTGVILSLGLESKNESEQLLKEFSQSIDGVYLKSSTIIRESVQIIEDFRKTIKEKGSVKPIIVDYRLDQEDLDDLTEISELLRSKGADAMTIMAIYDENFIKSCKEKAKIPLFAIVDIGLISFRERFSDAFIMTNAVSAIQNGCAGIITTSQHLDRIRKVRDAIGINSQLLSVIEKEDKIGTTLSFGSDFEIVPSRLLRK